MQLPEPDANKTDDFVSSEIVTLNGHLFLANAGLMIYTISDPPNVHQIGAYIQPNAWDVAVTGNVAVFVEGNQPAGNGSHLYTISLPDLNILGQYSDEAGCRQCISSFGELTIKDDIAYVSASNDGLRIIDLTEPAMPNLLGRIDIANGVGLLAGDIAADGRLYTADTGHCSERNLIVLDVADPTSPQALAHVELEGCIRQLAFDNGVLYVTAVHLDRDRDEEVLHLLDVTATEPQHLAVVTLSAAANDVQITGGMVILATATGLTVVSTVDPTQPRILAELLIPGGIYETAVKDNFLQRQRPNLLATAVSWPLICKTLPDLG